MQVSRLDNSLVINSRLPGYVNLTTSPFLAKFRVWPVHVSCLCAATGDYVTAFAEECSMISSAALSNMLTVAVVCLQFESPGVIPNLLEQNALLNGVTNSVPKLTQCRVLNITTVS